MQSFLIKRARPVAFDVGGAPADLNPGPFVDTPRPALKSEVVFGRDESGSDA